MESIDRLRKWSCHVEVQQLADEIEAEITGRYIELPKGGDGEVLRIGDEVWFHDDEPGADPHVVRGYSMLNGQDVDVFVNYADEGWCPNAVTMPDVLVHAKPDRSWSCCARSISTRGTCATRTLATWTMNAKRTPSASAS